jgi:hydroxypyruvate reductase
MPNDPVVAADADTSTRARATAVACFEAAVSASLPGPAVREAVTVDGGAVRIGDARYDLGAFDRVVVVGGGKAAGGVVDALVAVLGDRIDGGAVVVPAVETDASGEGADAGDGDEAGPVERLPGDHPTPTERGVASARRIAAIAEAADAGTLVLAAVTGGGSALLPAPVDGVSLADLRATTEALLASGATIRETNAVRRHLSTIKGGGLARAAAPATLATLLVSDVVGDDPATIASGPTVPDDTTFADALAVLDRYDLAVPSAVRDSLRRGADGDPGVPETARPDDPAFDRGSVHVLVGGRTALAAAREAALARGYDAVVLSGRVRGEAREAALSGVAVVEEVLATGSPVSPPAVVVSGGECTVAVEGGGAGGPNLEYALAAAAGFDAGGVDAPPSALADRVAILAADSDGRDGGTDAAGALVDPGTVAPADRVAARDALARNDALGFLAGDVVVTGPTGTNVNDVRIHVVEDD